MDPKPLLGIFFNALFQTLRNLLHHLHGRIGRDGLFKHNIKINAIGAPYAKKWDHHRLGF
tara:strand:- start:12 stop:191 length:180 start_codon:yes stop_codon:yes gene_type:complete